MKYNIFLFLFFLSYLNGLENANQDLNFDNPECNLKQTIFVEGEEPVTRCGTDDVPELEIYLNNIFNLTFEDIYNINSICIEEEFFKTDTMTRCFEKKIISVK